MQVRASATNPPSLPDDWNARWDGPDKGLIAAWRRGLEKRIESPELVAYAMANELPVLAWRGGDVISGITKKLSYLVVGGLGSQEWKHGSFSTKIEKAIQYRADGVPLLIVHEDVWAGSLSSAMAS